MWPNYPYISKEGMDDPLIVIVMLFCDPMATKYCLKSLIFTAGVMIACHGAFCTQTDERDYWFSIMWVHTL